MPKIKYIPIIKQLQLSTGFRSSWSKDIEFLLNKRFLSLPSKFSVNFRDIKCRKQFSSNRVKMEIFDQDYWVNLSGLIYNSYYMKTNTMVIIS
jgi:hypothetical protein